MVANPLKITDVTLRDGHQSLFATRMQTADMRGAAPDMDRLGLWSAEVWGGATFDVMVRFLNEDPWDRMRTLRKLFPRTRLQMLLRGQNLVGYRHYADDVVEAFVKEAAGCGVDIFRVFDALNDERNLETAFRAIKAAGRHVQGAICYALTESKLGGEIYTMDYYLNKAMVLQQMGADSVCIKDMSGVMAPDDAFALTSALKRTLKVPLHLHCHATGGMACMSYLKAIEAGVDIIDTDFGPLALRTAHPPIEPIVMALRGTPRDTGLDIELLLKIDDYFESVVPRYREFLDQTGMACFDPRVVWHQVPGGMTSNLVAQLKGMGALERLPEVYAEVPRVRRELGNPPLVTPTSQMVGVQAVQNVLAGRYKIISSQVRDYVYGLYGRPPGPIDPDVQRAALRRYERGETPITSRPADILEPEMDKAREATRGIARDAGDVLTYALYPATGLPFLKAKYGIEPLAGGK